MAGSAAYAAPPQSTDTDLSWIREIPGLKRAAASGTKTVYDVEQDLNGRFDKVRDALVKRGWTVEEETGTEPGVRAIRATKGDVSARIAITAD